MIKVETLGMIENAKINAVLQFEADVPNYSFITEDDITYLVANELSGDFNHMEGIVIPAGEYLLGYDLSAWTGQKLVIDEKHIAYEEGQSYDDIEEGTVLTIDDDGALAISDSAPDSGVYFTVTDKCCLTGKAVKAKVSVASGSSGSTGNENP